MNRRCSASASFAGRRMRAFGAEHLHYGDPRGSRELRTAIADHLLSARGLRCDPDQIMLTSGTQHALADRAGRDPQARRSDLVRGSRLPRRAKSDRTLRPARPVSVPVDDFGLIVAKGRALGAICAARPMSRRRTSFRSACRWRCRGVLNCSTGRGTPAPSMFEDDYDSEFRYDGAPLLSLAGIDHLHARDLHGHVCQDAVSRVCASATALPERLIGPVTTARAALDRFPGTLMEGAVADMLNSGAFAANLRKVRGHLSRSARRCWRRR